MKLLPDDGGQLVEEPEYFGARTFLKAAVERFPQLADDPDVEIGLHLSMAALARIAMQALRSGDPSGADAVAEFLKQVLERPRLHPEIRYAVAQSFLEPAELTTFEAGRAFLDSMPPSVRELLG
jgi:HEAT repeat protein